MEKIEEIRVHPDRLIITTHFENRTKIYPRNRIENLKKNNNIRKNELSKNSKRKLTRAITYLLKSSKVKSNYNFRNDKEIIFKVNFITLTLSSKQIHSDTQITRLLLNDFLSRIKKIYGVDKYVWRAEKQKNNNIHYHILVDKFIPHNELRQLWNNIQNKLGYVDRYRDQMKEFFKEGFRGRMELISSWSLNSQKKAYLTGKANDFSQPNSTDIHKIKLVSNLQAYVIKYMAKSDQMTNSAARLWGCSRILSDIKGALDCIDSEIATEIWKIKKYLNPYIFADSFFEVIFIDIDALYFLGCHRIYFMFMDYLKKFYDS